MTANLIARVEESVRKRPDSTALRCLGDDGSELRISWRALRDSAARVRDQLVAEGVSGSVLIESPNRAESLIALLGSLWAGTAAFPVSPQQPAPELHALASRSGVVAAIGGPRDLPVDLRIESVELAASEQPLAGAGSEDAGAILLQSSGTTGLPKIVRRGLAALDAVGSNLCRALALGAEDRMLIAIPLCHSYGIDFGLLAALHAGCEIELHESFVPARVAASLAAGEVTVLPAVPVMFDALSRSRPSTAAAGGLRRAISAGSPLPGRVFEQFQAGFGVSVGQVYGATEFGSVTYNDPDQPDFQPRSAGVGMTGVEIRILDLEAPDPERPLAAGREGHVAVSSSSLLSGYVDAEEEALTGGFFLTGDIGRLDARGRLFLEGRVKLLIDVGAQKVNPLEVEARLCVHPGVAEAVVLPVRVSDTVHRLKAIVIPESGARVDADDLKKHLQEQLAAFKVPRWIEVRSEVPRSPTGKILRRELMQAE